MRSCGPGRPTGPRGPLPRSSRSRPRPFRAPPACTGRRWRGFLRQLRPERRSPTASARSSSSRPRTRCARRFPRAGRALRLPIRRRCARTRRPRPSACRSVRRFPCPRSLRCPSRARDRRRSRSSTGRWGALPAGRRPYTRASPSRTPGSPVGRNEPHRRLRWRGIRPRERSRTASRRSRAARRPLPDLSTGAWLAFQTAFTSLDILQYCDPLSIAPAC